MEPENTYYNSMIMGEDFKDNLNALYERRIQSALQLLELARNEKAKIVKRHSEMLALRSQVQ